MRVPFASFSEETAGVSMRASSGPHGNEHRGRENLPARPRILPTVELRDLPPDARVVVRTTNWLGDVMISLPALRALRERFPDGHLAVQIRANLAELLAGVSWIDEVLPLEIRSGVAGLGDRLRAARALRERRFDLAVLFPNSFDSALLPFLAGIPRRLGYARDGRGPLLTDPQPATAGIRAVHQVRYYLNLLAPLGVVEADLAPVLEIPPRAAATASALLAELPGEGPVLALAAGSAYGRAREWPEENFARLAQILAARHGARFVLVGAPREVEQCRTVVELAGDLPGSGMLITAGRTTPADLAALLARCDGFFGNDSGAMHVAAAVGIPTLAIFGSTNPANTRPLGPRAEIFVSDRECSPCMARTCRYGHYGCLTDFTPEMVAQRLESMGIFGPAETEGGAP
ncbi:MAG TPA: lipopolysaccharide heptosyltransferase II [Acidobacteria bacterium]|nr:lipopolysaccharide heptosyltransferase II [Acidobacteriota bacterium]